MYYGLEKAVACGGQAPLLMKLESGSKSKAVIFLCHLICLMMKLSLT